MKLFSEVVAVVPKFHYLLTVATECVTKLQYFLKWNFYVEEESWLLCDSSCVAFKGIHVTKFSQNSGAFQVAL